MPAPFDEIRTGLEALIRRQGPNPSSSVVSARDAQAFNVLLQHAKAIVDPTDDSAWPRAFPIDRTQMLDSTLATGRDLAEAARKVLELLPPCGGTEGR